VPHPSGPGTALSNRIRGPKALDDGNEKTVAGVRLNDVLSGRYRLEQKIGEGGMGSVYLATDLELDRKVAVKLLAKSLVGDAEVVERFEREARLTAKLDHANIVNIYDVGRTGERPFIVMKKLEGDTLAGLLRQKGGLSPAETLKLLRQLAAGLDYIHMRGFIHRDVKAGNIFVGPDGHTTILDFGILRALRGHEALTRTGVVMGTPHYMAPEQALGSKDVDHRVDLYALAVVVFECLTGTLPFEADSELRLIQMQAHSPPPDLLDRAPWIAKPIAEVMKRALAKRADERFSSGAELLAALEVAYAQVPAKPLPPEDVSKRAKPSRGPYLALALAAVVVAAVGLGVTRPWEPAPAVAPVEPPVPVAIADAGAFVEMPDPALASVGLEDAGEPEATDAGGEEEELAAVIDAGRKAFVKGASKKGKLNVITMLKGEPYWAQVLIDGVSKGRTPLQLELPTGRYQVRVERPGFRTQSREIRVASGKAAVVRIDLTQ
jgi:eukaryotic-like serine/threonine-protein kinase